MLTRRFYRSGRVAAISHLDYYHNMADVEIGQRLECRKCHHTWHSRIARRPVQCPRCKSTSWEKNEKLVQTGAGEWITRDELWQRQKATDWADPRWFGAWADMEGTDEEILAKLREGWPGPNDERDVDG